MTVDTLKRIAACAPKYMGAICKGDTLTFLDEYDEPVLAWVEDAEPYRGANNCVVWLMLGAIEASLSDAEMLALLSSKSKVTVQIVSDEGMTVHKLGGAETRTDAIANAFLARFER